MLPSGEIQILMEMKQNKQLSIFSEADGFLEKAAAAVRELKFDRAEREMVTAGNVNPFLTNLETWRKIINLMKKEKKDGSLTDFISRTWHAVPDEVKSGRLHPHEAELADREIAEIALHHLGKAEGFLDEDQTVHWGFLLAACGKYLEAQKILLQSLTDNHTDHADLWAAYTNVLWQLNRKTEAHSAFVYALILDPFCIDLYRIKIPELKRLYEKLRMHYTESESQALLMFFGWMENFLVISRPQRAVKTIHTDIKKRIAETDDSGKTGRFRRFCLYFYLDRIRDYGDIDLEARERMMELAPDLFRMYMKKVEETQSELFAKSYGRR